MSALVSLRRFVRRRAAARRDQAGAIAVISALVALVLLLVAAFTVDIGGTWARRGRLQVQADQAAVYAADSLPAVDDASRLRVARAAAWYLACNPVAGQAELSTIPDCPATSSTPSTTLDAFAQWLLSTGRVTFPDANQVRVSTPPARVHFAFGQVVGASGNVQEKSATARIGSPGDIEPIGLSLNCMLSVAGNLPAGLGSTLSGVLPLNYLAPGPLTQDTPPTHWPAGQPETTAARTSAIVPTQVNQGMPLPFTVTGSGWTGVGQQVRVSFALGDPTRADYLYADLDTVVAAAGTATGNLPAVVYNHPGNWRVRVATKPLTGGSWTWTRQDVVLTVTLPQVTADILGCGRILKSPRNYQDGTPGNLRLNLQEGLDHHVTKHPSLLTLNPPDTSVSGVLSALGGANGIFQCSEASPSVKDTGGNLVNQLTPNCMVLAQGSTTYTEFTDGMLGAETTTTLPDGTTKQVAGRLLCTTSRPCARSFSIPTLPGRTFDDDRFSDFVTSSSLLSSAMFFNLSSYVNDGVPAVTPNGALSPDIYRSHRFFWVPVLSTPLVPNANANDAGAYPILTFRPVFITQKEATGVPDVDMVLDLVDLWVRTLLNIDSTDDHGVLMQGDTLRALRFMTIEPSALPAVPPTWDGPVSDYLGVGPKIIRLVK